MKKTSDRPNSMVPALRVSGRGGSAVRGDREFVLYWMTAQHRVQWNFALQRAADWAESLQRPLVIAEVLTCGGRWDSARHHRFALDGMRDNAAALRGQAVCYLPIIERKQGVARARLASLTPRAAVIVADDHPIGCSAAVADDCPALVERVDSNGLLPLRATGRAYPSAFTFRRHLQQQLRAHLMDLPAENPLHGRHLPPPPDLTHVLGSETAAAQCAMPDGEADDGLVELPLRHDVKPVAERGGTSPARARLAEFLRAQLPQYHLERNQPENPVASRLSPYLHFGHISVHEIFLALATHTGWSPLALGERASGQRGRWWGMGDAAEAFLDELITWRELGFNGAMHLGADLCRFEGLPDWARLTLARHATDPRSHIYALEEFAAAETHDPLWNAAQRQLLREGTIHNYLRMLWGKKILEWTASPHDAWDVMIELNNRYALDGNDPNSYAGIGWVLGRYDRAWGPERPIFGTVRYMSSENTAKKMRVKGYLARYGAAASGAEAL